MGSQSQTQLSNFTSFFSFLEIQEIIFEIHVILNFIKMDSRCLMFIEWEKKLLWNSSNSTAPTPG